MAKTNDEIYTIEELRDKHHTPKAVFNAVCISMGWRSEKMLRESEYIAAIKKWLGGNSYAA